VGRLQGCISATLSDVIVRMVTHGAFGCC
jgi:hypothetical protein